MQSGEKQRTLLLLGGSPQQVVALEAAKSCGYRTVLCDYLPDNPGQFAADVFYQESTTDRETILRIAREENIDGIIAYSSDPAAPTAAYVAEQLGLPTNPLAAVETLSEKHLFRQALREAGLPCPQAVSFSSVADSSEVASLVEGFSFPLVVKPTDSSGSKGVSVIQGCDELKDAIVHARGNSRNGILIAEEYIQRSYPNVVGGDIFVLDGKVEFWGLMDCLRDERCGLVPVGKALPPKLTDAQRQSVKETFQKLVDYFGIRFGELNVEALIGYEDKTFVLELGSRAGGNMIPVQLSDASDIDLVRANVMCAMGDNPGNVSWEMGDACYVTHVLHSVQDGVYQGYSLSPMADKACYRRVIYQEEGAPVQRFDGANKALGILFFKFEEKDSFGKFISCPTNHVKVFVGGANGGVIHES